MKKNNIVLISLYDLDSLSVRTLHAVLTKNRFEVHSIFFKRQHSDNTMDYPTESDIKALIRLVKDHDPLFVGISVRSTLFKLSARLTDEIKKETGVLVIWGGIHPTIKPYQCLEAADVVCVGEGEQAIVELARELSAGNSINNIKNFWVKTEGRIIENDLSPLIQDLNSLPFPDFTDGNKWFINNGQVSPVPGSEQRTIYWMMTSRGCMFSCTYCCNNTLKRIYKGKGKYLRRRSVESVIAELAYAKDILPNLDFIAFVDDIFVYDIDWLKDFCTLYKERIALPFFCFFHPKVINEDLASMLKDAGVEYMCAGIQSGSEDVRRRYFNRYEKNDDIIRAAEILNRYQIECAYNLILDNPVETDNARMESLKLLLQLPKPYELQPTTLTHFPETELTNLLLSKGLISEEDVEDQKQKSFERWSLVLDLMRDNRDLYWDNLYFLANKRHIPKSLLFLLSHFKLLKKYPRPLTRLLRDISPYLKTGSRSERLLDITAQQIARNAEKNKILEILIFLLKPFKSRIKRFLSLAETIEKVKKRHA